MTWLLHQFQKVLGVLTGSHRRTDVSAPTQFGDKAAARLQQSRMTDLDAPVAKRVSGSQSSDPSAEVMAVTQSTAPLRQKSSSVLKDTVDPVATAPDTHRRLDAAPAATPGGTPATPSFPTDVSELISAHSTLSPTLKNDGDTGDLSISNVPSPADEQLPDIHDLLPAIEPDEADSPLSEKLLEADDSHEQVGSAEDTTIVEAAERVAASSEQATLFSFDITEADITEADIAEADIAEADVAEADTTPDAGIASEMTSVEETTRFITSTPEIELAEIESAEEEKSEEIDFDRPAVQSSDDDSQALLEESQTTISRDTEPAAENSVLTPEDSVDNKERLPLVTETTQIGSDRLESVNPWLTATPPPKTQSSAPVSTESLSTKQGTIKLLFTLKPGNFHGYIAPEDGSKDILFHQKYINAEIFDELERGARVVATVKNIEGKVYATRVDRLQE